MEKLTCIKSIKRVHFIGVGGINMSALAKWCICKNLSVSGSDKVKSDLTNQLENLGAKIFIGENVNSVKGANLVVYTSAISKDNKELLYAINNNIAICKRSEFLALILKEYKYSVCVAGSHGKTTITAMVTHVLNQAKLFPTAFIGGLDNDFSNFYYGKRNYVVAEACEYKKNFLDLSPNAVILSNIDNDHMDSYKNEHNMICAFEHFIFGKKAFINYDCNKCKTLSCKDKVTFGLDKRADFTAKYLSYNGKGYSFSVYKNKSRLGRINLQVFGKHNVYNALGSIAFAENLNIDFAVIKNALENFSLAKRRGEYIGNIKNIKCYADYAHHPSEIAVTLDAFIKSREKDIIVFQPHTYSRTENLLLEFISSLSKVKKLIIYKTYPARERYNKNGSAKRLYTELKKVNKNLLYAHNPKQLNECINILSGNVKRVIFLGAGDIYDIAKDLMD